MYKDQTYESYIPCKLSNIVNYLPSVYISECEFHDFTTTYNNLKYIYNVTRNKIPCEPIEQIVDKKLVFGIKTIGNLLVPLKIPEQITNKDFFIKKTIISYHIKITCCILMNYLIDKINDKNETLN